MNKALTTRNYVGVFTHVHGGRVETLRIIHRVRGRDVSERLLSLDGSGPRIHSRRQRAHLLFPRPARGPGRAPRARRSVARRAAGHRRRQTRRSTKSAAASASACSAAPRAWSRCIRATNIATATGCGSTSRRPCRSRPSSATSPAKSSSRSCSPPSICPSAFPTPCSSRRWMRPTTAGSAPIARSRATPTPALWEAMRLPPGFPHGHALGPGHAGLERAGRAPRLHRRHRLGVGIRRAAQARHASLPKARRESVRPRRSPPWSMATRSPPSAKCRRTPSSSSPNR